MAAVEPVLFIYRGDCMNDKEFKQMLDGLVEFRAAVVQDMEDGNESGMYYVSNVAKSDVHNINKYID